MTEINLDFYASALFARNIIIPVADPGFPFGGADPLGGRPAKMYAETKELGLVSRGAPLDPPINTNQYITYPS